MELRGTQLRVFVRIAGSIIDMETANTQAEIRKHTKMSRQQQSNIISNLVKAKLIRRLVNKENKNKTFYTIDPNGVAKVWNDYLKVRIPNLKKPKSEKQGIDFIEGVMLRMSFQMAFILQLEEGFVFPTIEEIFNDITLPSIKDSSKGNPSKYYKRINKYVADKKTVIDEKIKALKQVNDLSSELMEPFRKEFNIKYKIPSKKISGTMSFSKEVGETNTKDGRRVFVKKERSKGDCIRIDANLCKEIGITKEGQWVKITNPAFKEPKENARSIWLLAKVGFGYDVDFGQENIRMSPENMKSLGVTPNDKVYIMKMTETKNKGGGYTFKGKASHSDGGDMHKEPLEEPTFDPRSLKSLTELKKAVSQGKIKEIEKGSKIDKILDMLDKKNKVRKRKLRKNHDGN